MKRMIYLILAGLEALLVLAVLPVPRVEAATGPAPTNAAEMNDKVNNIEGLGSGDAFRTIRLPDGRWLSLLGDNTNPGQSLPSRDNSFVMWDSDGQRRVNTTADSMGNAFPRWSDGSEFWPGQPVIVGSKMYVPGSRQKVRGDFDWTPLGAWIAVVQLVNFGDPYFVRYVSTPSSGSDDSVVQWYSGMTSYGGYIYLHGVKDRPDAFHARDGGYVARMPVSGVEQLNQWRYWTGLGWSQYEHKAVSTIPTGGAATNGTESGYTLHRRPNGEWQVTTKNGGTLSSSLGRYTSVNPYGPWTWTTLVEVCAFECYVGGAVDTVPTSSGNLLIYHNRSGTVPYWYEVSQ